MAPSESKDSESPNQMVSPLHNEHRKDTKPRTVEEGAGQRSKMKGNTLTEGDRGESAAWKSIRS